MPSHLQAIAIPSKEHLEGVVELFAQFDVGRTVTQIHHPTGFPDIASLSMQRDLPPNVLRVDLIGSHRGAVLNGPTQLLVRSAPEPVHFVRFLAVRDDGARFLLLALVDKCPSETTTYSKHEPEKGSPLLRFYGPEEYRAELEERLRTSKDPAERFFIDLDLQTHPVAQNNRSQTCSIPSQEIVQVALRSRLNIRVHHLYERGEVSDQIWFSNRSREFFPGIICFFRQLAEKHLRDFAAIDDAFDRFANGQLRWSLRDGQWATQPSSGFYFLFGELGLAAWEMAVSTDNDQAERWWRPVATTMIRTQQVFMRAYPRQAKGTTYGAYSGCGYCPKGAFSSEKLAALRDRYGDLNLNEVRRRATINAMAAMPDLLGHCCCE